MSTLQDKHRLLQDILRSYDKVAIAYSGGVDSSLLSYVAKETLGSNAPNLGLSAQNTESSRLSVMSIR